MIGILPKAEGDEQREDYHRRPAPDANRSSGHEAGFYAVGRMFLPVISFLRSLYKGSDTTHHSVLFMEKYADPKYQRLAAATVASTSYTSPA
jgi:hypothetical protein